MNNKEMLHIGFNNIVMTRRIIAILSPESAPVKRIVAESKDKGVAVDVTHGRRTRAVILTDTDFVFLSSLQPETLAGRMNSDDESNSSADQADL